MAARAKYFMVLALLVGGNADWKVTRLGSNAIETGRPWGLRKRWCLHASVGLWSHGLWMSVGVALSAGKSQEKITAPAVYPAFSDWRLLFNRWTCGRNPLPGDSDCEPLVHRETHGNSHCSPCLCCIRSEIRIQGNPIGSGSWKKQQETLELSHLMQCTRAMTNRPAVPCCSLWLRGFQYSMMHIHPLGLLCADLSASVRCHRLLLALGGRDRCSWSSWATQTAHGECTAIACCLQLSSDNRSTA